jgi:hypothetical protein
MMRKRLILALLLCSLPLSALAQVGGKWKRITSYSNKTGDATTAISVNSLAAVPEREDNTQHIAALLIIGGSRPMMSIRFGQWVYLEHKELDSESWLDDAGETPLKIRWIIEQDMCGAHKPCINLVELPDGQLLKRLGKARLFHISFWASDGQRYVHTFPIAGFTAHMRFLGITQF